MTPEIRERFQAIINEIAKHPKIEAFSKERAILDLMRMMHEDEYYLHVTSYGAHAQQWAPWEAIRLSLAFSWEASDLGYMFWSDLNTHLHTK